MIPIDYNPNYDFVTCQAWIEWINKQEIILGQPCVKEDLHARKLPLEERVHSVCLAQPANKRFNPSIRRLFLPRSAEQFMEFLIYKEIFITISTNEQGFCLHYNTFVEESSDVLKLLGKFIQHLKKIKVVK